LLLGCAVSLAGPACSGGNGFRDAGGRCWYDSDCPQGYFCDLEKDQCQPAGPDGDGKDGDFDAGEDAGDANDDAGEWGGDGGEPGTEAGSDSGCPEPEEYERYCFLPTEPCRYIGAFCHDGSWTCDTGFVHPPPPPDFDDWAWQCGVYTCYAWDVPEEPGPDWQEEKPYVPPDPASLTGEWVKVADSDDIVPVGCERQPRGYAIVSNLAVNPQNPNVMYTSFFVRDNTPSIFAAGVFKSVDGGESWFEARAGLGAAGCYGLECTTGPSVNRLYMDPDDPNVLFAGTTERGLYRTRDGGRYWEFVDLPYECAFPEPVGKSPTGIYYLGCRDKLYRSIDGGETFEKFATLGSMGRGIITIAFDERLPDRIWAGMCEGCEEYPRDGEGFLFLSDDGGQTWQELGQELDASCRGACAVWDIDICPNDPEQMAVSIYPCGLFTSSDGGISWRRAAAPLDGNVLSSAAYAPTADRCRLYAGEQGVYGLYYTEDAGRSWTLEYNKYLDDLFFNPYLPQMIYGIIIHNMGNDEEFELHAKK